MAQLVAEEMGFGIHYELKLINLYSWKEPTSYVPFDCHKFVKDSYLTNLISSSFLPMLTHVTLFVLFFLYIMFYGVNIDFLVYKVLKCFNH